MTIPMTLEREAEDAQHLAALIPALHELARREFEDFCKFVKVPVEGIGMVPLEMWPHTLDAIRTLSTENLIVWAKARQIGITTVLAAFAVWHASYRPNALVVIFSRGQGQAYTFLAKCRAIWKALPDGLRVDTGSGVDFPNNREQMTLSNGSQIVAFPSTEDAARGLTPTLAIFDEADYHDYIEAGYSSVKPGISNPVHPGQMIVTSTVNAYKLGSFFQNLYKRSPQNGFVKMFYNWRVVPTRTDTWYEQEKLTYQDMALFIKENPNNEQEAFAPTRAIAAFDMDILEWMNTRCLAPIEMPTMQNGVTANIYQRFSPGVRYSAATDTSHGTGKDNAVTVVLDTITGAVAADIVSSVVNPNQLAIASVELLNMYDSPIWGIEDNDWGINTITEAQNLKYPRLYHHEIGQAGWHTWDAQGHPKGSRFQIWGDLIEAINNQRLTIFNEDGLAEFFTVIRNPEKNGRIEAQQGAHDDYPMAMCIAYQLIGQARPSGGTRGRSIPDREVGEGGAPIRTKLKGAVRM